jgi:hypothetical protein
LGPKYYYKKGPEWRTLETYYEVNTRMKEKHTDLDWAGVDGNSVRTQF